MTKNEWKQNIEIDSDESTNIFYDDLDTYNENGNKIFKKGLDVHFNATNNAVYEMLGLNENHINVSDNKTPDLTSDRYADLYVSIFDRNNIEYTLVVTDNDSKGYFSSNIYDDINCAKVGLSDELKQAFIEVVEEYNDMTLEEVIEHAKFDIEYEE